ncbi:HD family hydrolase [Mariniflexile gromovii]|uniref:HD domain-containing protein n=1 Tax=Mariniflexile gromovii TaxID=362523 RepID=A0ABS4BWS1_9FLAO|nr:HD domain-containing protein [Mariniflexile gromovii]MBP0905046.1 HD domain-containing protein [Mariniflexile gromovii]
MSLESIVKFLTETDKLKLVERHTSPIDSPRKENVAEHSWQLVLMAILLKDYANEKININKVVKMLIIHDLVEIYAGDTFLFDNQNSHDNNDQELHAAKNLYKILPKSNENELYGLWYEFEYGDTPEKHYAKSIDRFAPVLLNFNNKGGTWKKHNISYENLINKLNPINKGSEKLWELTLNYLDKLIQDGHIRCEK